MAVDTKNKFSSIDGLRTLGALCIVLMHVLANSNYQLNSFIFDKVIGSFAIFVFLFMMISSFGMCCGYYYKIKNNKISPNEFFSKRYKKIFYFFSILVMLDVLVARNINSLIEGVLDLTLLFSFLPNPNISVIGVGWTLGVIFVFYVLFPFFVFLMDNKGRAWVVLFISICLRFLCQFYFFSSDFVVNSFSYRTNIIYCFPFFVIGGLLFLYKDDLIKFMKNKQKTMLAINILLVITYIFLLYYNVNIEIANLVMYLLFICMLVYSICFDSVVLNNKITNFISDNSMEIYLSHMVIFRIVEKLNILHIFSLDILSYIFSYFVVLLGTIVFSLVLKSIILKVRIGDVKR